MVVGSSDNTTTIGRAVDVVSCVLRRRIPLKLIGSLVYLDAAKNDTLDFGLSVSFSTKTKKSRRHCNKGAIMAAVGFFIVFSL